MNLETSCADNVTLPADSNVASGDFVQQGQAITGYAITDGDNSTDGYAIQREAVVYGAAKATGTAWVLGDRLDHDGDEWVKATGRSVYRGIAAAAAASGDATGDVILLDSPVPNPANDEKLTVPIPLVANSAKTYLLRIPFDCTITDLNIMASVTLASTSGTILLAAIKVGGSTILATASTDIEGTVGGTETDVPLTATGANLVMSAGDFLKFTVTSNNADATGGGDTLAIVSVTPA